MSHEDDDDGCDSDASLDVSDDISVTDDPELLPQPLYNRVSSPAMRDTQNTTQTTESNNSRFVSAKTVTDDSRVSANNSTVSEDSCFTLNHVCKKRKIDTV